MKKRFKSFIITVIGITVTTFAYSLFLNPYMISVGGLTGLCVLLQAHVGLPYTITLNMLNLGLFVWGIKVKGIAYVIRSYVAMSILGLLLDIPYTPFISISPIVALVLGSLLSGIGYGLIVSQNTSTGGSDLMAMIVTKLNPRLTTGMVMTMLDLVVVTISGLLEGTENFVISLIAMILCNGMIDITAYLLGSTSLPTWLHWLRKHLASVAASVKQARIEMNPYALILTFCVFFLIYHEMFVGFPLFVAA